MIWLFLLLACDPQPHGSWSVKDALSASLALLDQDGDGHVGAAEYELTLYYGPAFQDADQDRDGALSAWELGMLLKSVDPLHFDAEGQSDRGSWDHAPAEDLDHAAMARVELLVFLWAELLARDPALEPPSVSQLQELAARGPQGAAELEAMLVQLREEHRRLGLAFPKGLLED